MSINLKKRGLRRQNIACGLLSHGALLKDVDTAGSRGHGVVSRSTYRVRGLEARRAGHEAG